jgi:hypothetical protein
MLRKIYAAPILEQRPVPPPQEERETMLQAATGRSRRAGTRATPNLAKLDIYQY